MVDDELRELAALLTRRVPAVMISELLVNVDAYEAKVGLGRLRDTLSGEE